VVHKAIKV